jgi:hypothetical protein
MWNIENSYKVGPRKGQGWGQEVGTLNIGWFRVFVPPHVLNNVLDSAPNFFPCVLKLYSICFATVFLWRWKGVYFQTPLI